MKARSLRVLALIAALFLAGCNGSLWGPALAGSSPGEDCLHRILDRGSLRVGMSGQQAPLNMKNAAGALVGLDVDLARALAAAMRVELELVERPFAELLDALEAGEVDLVVSSLTITPSRNARVAFAGPYMISGSSLLTRRELLPELVSLGDLNTPERSWSALANSTGQALIADAFPLARYVEIEDQEAAVERVVAGEIDGLVADVPFVEWALGRHAGKGLATLGKPFTTEPLGVALPPNSPLFANLVQNYLNTLSATGELMQMKMRWLSGRGGPVAQP